ncbi:MAG: hypothetical protein AAGC45_04085 [Bacteroidota bacterium]
MILLKTIYLANIVVAGYVGLSSLCVPKTAAATVFSNAYEETEIIRLVGCLWLGITLLSALGLWKPLTFSPVRLLQLLYKGTWFLVVALPAVVNRMPYPSAMAAFFLVLCLVLPVVIPWAKWFELIN